MRPARMALGLLLAAGACSSASGLSGPSLWMPAIFGDHMVLQRGATVSLWGRGEPGSTVAVRYGWGYSPACNLYSAAGLPASPFRTDEWAWEDAKKKDDEDD